MTFAESKVVTLPAGSRLGEAIDDVAATDDGLRYLDWLAGCGYGWTVTGLFGGALKTYLADPQIQAEVKALVGGS